ncbi:MAG TPA: proline--tRNA ligase [Ignisphaera aggregans]|uniref:Proline--tRNA ligase n=1 Tax=Ignisphaera aggregans TaxID=334771 RepID=A0A832Z114_9CREN|nr:proline--tRNA ligase [Ignisphaera aggregans]
MVSKCPKKEGESFSEWFECILREAEIYDYGRYPVKGVGVWLPYGFQIRKHVIETIRKLLDETGHEEILLPLLIPETIFRKESEHVRGFEGEVYWVTKAGFNELDVRLVLRPTSETVLSYMESLWIKSYRQLPKKYYQIVNIFRYETKMTKPMIRLREVSTFKEAHTLHESFEDAERLVMEAVNIYREFFDLLGIPYLISKRPQWDKFAGALYTIAFDTLLPDGKALQIGTVHNLGQTFTSVYDVKIQKRDETIDYGWQTSYGISERVIASVIAFHSDERGLILPPLIAPIQVVVVPIPVVDNAEKRKEVMEYAQDVYSELKSAGYRVKLDDREELRPVDKYFEWELKGVPLRVEIGKRETEQRKVTLFRRDTLQRYVIERPRLIEAVSTILKEIGEYLRQRAWKWFSERIKTFDSLDEAIDYVRQGGIAQIPWCGDEREAYEAIEKLEAVSVLGAPIPAIERVDVTDKKCALCGGKAYTYLRLAKRY